MSSGAVLRALNKRDGPKRISRSSYGFLCTEEHEPDEFPAHRGIRPFSEPLDGRKYVKYTIFWLINKVSVLVCVRLRLLGIVIYHTRRPKRSPRRKSIPYRSFIFLMLKKTRASNAKSSCLFPMTKWSPTIERVIRKTEVRKRKEDNIHKQASS